MSYFIRSRLVSLADYRSELMISEGKKNWKGRGSLLFFLIIRYRLNFLQFVSISVSHSSRSLVVEFLLRSIGSDTFFSGLGICIFFSMLFQRRSLYRPLV